MWVGGTLLEAEGGQAYNTFALLDAVGDLRAAYRKVHLFRLMGEDRWLAPGDRFVTTDLGWGTAGLATCYDLRFPEMFRALVSHGATVLLVPAAWPEARAKHWSLLLRARWRTSASCWAATVPAAPGIKALPGSAPSSIHGVSHVLRRAASRASSPPQSLSAWSSRCGQPCRPWPIAGPNSIEPGP
jgi:hypothetical protein